MNRILKITIAAFACISALCSCNKAGCETGPEFTGLNYGMYLDSLSTDNEGEPRYEAVNEAFRSELLFKRDSDIEETDFVKSITERYNRMSFGRLLSSEVQIWQRLDEDYPINIKFTPEEIRSIVEGKDMAETFTTIDGLIDNGEILDEEKLFELISEIIDLEYSTPDPVSEEDILSFRDNFDSWYDKTQIVKDADDLIKARLDDNNDRSDEYIDSIRARLQSASDFDSRCIYALELSRLKGGEEIDCLGEIIESQNYSKYLYEVWMLWKYTFQEGIMGVSTWSVIPDMYYEKVRNLVLNTMLRHIQSNPDDTEAKCLAFNIAVESNLDRFNAVYGNASLLYCNLLEKELFIPERLQNEKDVE